MIYARIFMRKKLRCRVKIIKSVEIINNIPASAVKTFVICFILIENRWWIYRKRNRKMCSNPFFPRLSIRSQFDFKSTRIELVLRDNEADLSGLTRMTKKTMFIDVIRFDEVKLENIDFKALFFSSWLEFQRFVFSPKQALLNYHRMLNN